MKIRTVLIVILILLVLGIGFGRIYETDPGNVVDREGFEKIKQRCAGFSVPIKEDMRKLDVPKESTCFGWLY